MGRCRASSNPDRLFEGSCEARKGVKAHRLTHPAIRRAPRVLQVVKELKIRLTDKLEEDLISATEDQDAERSTIAFSISSYLPSQVRKLGALE